MNTWKSADLACSFLYEQCGRKLSLLLIIQVTMTVQKDISAKGIELFALYADQSWILEEESKVWCFKGQWERDLGGSTSNQTKTQTNLRLGIV